jgi:putative Na+/H+ antiporter
VRLLILNYCLLGYVASATAAMETGMATEFPPALSSYPTLQSASIWEILKARIQAHPFNLVATIIFVLAIVHTFIAPSFLSWSHRLQEKHQERLVQNKPTLPADARQEVSFFAELFHFLGEVEAIFGIWVVPLLIAITMDKGWPVARDYLSHGVNFTEPLFVVVIMTIAASRPMLKLSEQSMALIAELGKGKPFAWWFSILTIGPVLGSFITEPAAMTICALLLADKFYELRPNSTFAYATLGLLFVNVSVGGTLTSFAAPPVLMVSGQWGWGLSHMMTHFGWKAVVGIIIANLLYAFWFRREFALLSDKSFVGGTTAISLKSADQAIPIWVTVVHVLFLGWTVINAHYPALFIGGFLFYLAFLQATEHHQNELPLRPALLVGFFLAGLVVHGRLQGWWIGPVLGRLSETPLFFGATILTAFNDNAAITYLASQVPNLSDSLKYAVVAGAVAGGGLTVIANAPNPAGQSILSRFFPEGISALRLLLGALVPTAVLIATFLLIR